MSILLLGEVLIKKKWSSAGEIYVFNLRALHCRDFTLRLYLQLQHNLTLAFLISGLAVKLPAIKTLGTFAEISPSLFWMGWSVPLVILDAGAKK